MGELAGGESMAVSHNKKWLGTHFFEAKVAARMRGFLDEFPAIMLAPNKLVLSCITYILLSYSHLAGIQPNKSNWHNGPLAQPASGCKNL